MSKLVPLLVQPKLLTQRNRWKKSREELSRLVRDLSIVLLTLVLIAVTFYATKWILSQLSTELDFIYLPSSVLMGLILLFLLAMLIITNTISALGGLYFSRDLQLVLSAPISGTKFFWGKFIETVSSSSWMTFVFILPVILAFGVYYDGPPSYYLYGIFLLLPYFIIPAAISMIISTLFVVLIPVTRRKEIGILSFIGILFLIYRLGRTLFDGLGAKESLEMSDMLRVVGFLTLTNKDWTPAYWVSQYLGGILEPGPLNSLVLLKLLISASALLLSLAYLTLVVFYESGYARANYTGSRKRPPSRLAIFVDSILSKVVSRPVKALIEKEGRVVSRDVTQAVQFVLLLGICGLYLYSLTIQGLFTQAIPVEKLRWWKAFLIVVNICVESFVITAMGSRFVFPSISREGRSFWTLQTAPFRMERILRIKYLVWFAIIGLMSSLIFGTATFLVTGKISLALLKVASNLILNIGIVGLAVGLGAYFANFNWDHIGQVSTSFGSLVYMVVSVCLIVANIVAICAGYYLGVLRVSLRAIDPSIGTQICVAFFVGLLVLNVLVALFAIRLGERNLLLER